MDEESTHPSSSMLYPFGSPEGSRSKVRFASEGLVLNGEGLVFTCAIPFAHWLVCAHTDIHTHAPLQSYQVL